MFPGMLSSMVDTTYIVVVGFLLTRRAQETLCPPRAPVISWGDQNEGIGLIVPKTNLYALQGRHQGE